MVLSISNFEADEIWFYLLTLPGLNFQDVFYSQFDTPPSKQIRIHIMQYFFFKVEVYTYLEVVSKI